MGRRKRARETQRQRENKTFSVSACECGGYFASIDKRRLEREREKGKEISFRLSEPVSQNLGTRKIFSLLCFETEKKRTRRVEKNTGETRELLSLCPPRHQQISPPRVPVIITSPSPFPSSCIGRKLGSCRCCTIRTRSSPSSSESRISMISIFFFFVCVRFSNFNSLYKTPRAFALEKRCSLSLSLSVTHKNARRTTTTCLCVLSSLRVCLCVCVYVSARYVLYSG
jgi:hypothetical protein